MHLVLLGVMKRLLAIWIKGDYSRSHKLSRKNRTTVNGRLFSISECCSQEYARRPDNIADFEQFKATEFRQILLNSGIVIFKGILSKYTYFHFVLLHVAILCLIFHADSQKHLHLARICLDKFVQKSKLIYPLSFLSYNVYGLTHLVKDVKNFGGLDSFSAFPFENVMERFKSLVRKPHLSLQQISKRIAILIYSFKFFHQL